MISAHLLDKDNTKSVIFFIILPRDAKYNILTYIFSIIIPEHVTMTSFIMADVVGNWNDW